VDKKISDKRNKPGPKPKEKVKIKWSADFAYAIGLLVTDGCLCRDGCHIDFTSKDQEQIKNFLSCLHISASIGIKDRNKNNQTFRVQIGDVIFYDFLLAIGLMPRKSLILGSIKIPNELFFDFLRGCLDGDGCSYSYWDPRWKSSFMFYISFASGSVKFIKWLRSKIFELSKMKGHISVQGKKEKSKDFYQLRFSKYEAIWLVGRMYYKNNVTKLTRKYLKIQESLAIVRTHKGRVFVQ
jgi:hypothetical protein